LGERPGVLAGEVVEQPRLAVAVEEVEAALALDLAESGDELDPAVDRADDREVVRGDLVPQGLDRIVAHRPSQWTESGLSSFGTTSRRTGPVSLATTVSASDGASSRAVTRRRPRSAVTETTRTE